MESYLDGKVTLYRGDCLEVLPALEANSIDACVTDPPYHLTEIKTSRQSYAAQLNNGRTAEQKAARKGFMGKNWDGGDIAFRPEIWAEVLRILKPGAHLLAFSGTRTYHRMACAIEDAGFEIRDQIGWCYGSGFPKSHNIGNGWGTALKPAWEPICLARKPLSEPSIAANVLKHGAGGINVDGCRVVGKKAWPVTRSYTVSQRAGIFGNNGAADLQETANDGLGRWPANLIHDGSEEVLAGFPETPGQQGNVSGLEPSDCHSGVYSGPRGRLAYEARNDSGSAARFFYTAKADTDDRLGSKHPTVKPLDLMQYLVRLVTPKGGLVLDPFAGTGTLGEAAYCEGCRSMLIEREAEYQADIVKRMGLCLSGPDTRRAASVTQLAHDDLPMFRGLK